MDSTEIARYAGQRVPAKDLFPPSQEARIQAWGEIVERGLDASRPAVFERTLAHPAQMAPSFIPGPLRGPAVQMAMAYMCWSFDVETSQSKTYRARAHAALLETRTKLAGRTHAAGDSFTYADLLVCSLLHMVRPPAALPMNGGYRKILTDEAFAAEFADLLAWRDATYARYRSPQDPMKTR
jgi:glutathione S-transferase